MKVSTKVLVTLSALLILAMAGGAWLALKAGGSRQVASYYSARITCGACSDKVVAALESQSGIGEVAVEVASQQVRVAFDPARTDPERIALALNGAGFPARLVGLGNGAAGKVAAAGGCGGACCPPR